LIWGYIFSGAAIVALILGLFAFYNRRATRKLIIERKKPKVARKVSRDNG